MKKGAGLMKKETGVLKKGAGLMKIEPGCCNGNSFFADFRCTFCPFQVLRATKLNLSSDSVALFARFFKKMQRNQKNFCFPLHTSRFQPEKCTGKQVCF